MGAPAGATARRRFPAAADGRDRRLAVAVGAVAAVGAAVAGYLVYVHYAGIEPICAAGSGGCHKVQNSAYAELAGIPVALLGLLGYLAVLATLLVRGELGRVAACTLALVGFGFSLYLTYREVFTIEAICQWCVGSAVLMTLLAALTTVRLIRADL